MSNQTVTQEGAALVYLNEQHTLLPSQEQALNDRFERWELIPVPASGWTVDEMWDRVAGLPFLANVVFGSPIPAMIGWASSRAQDCGLTVFVLHNDRREAKEIVDRATGQTKVIHTLAPDGWELLRVA